MSSAIGNANKQFKPFDRLGLPCLLVLYNNVYLSNYTDSYHIKTGMFGFEVVNLAVPKNLMQKAYVVERKFGPRQRMRPNEKTRISAVGVLNHHTEDKSIQFLVYHNCFATVRIDPQPLRQVALAQFCLEAKKGPRDFQDWERV